MEFPLPSDPITESFRREHRNSIYHSRPRSPGIEGKSRRGCYRVSDKLLHCELCDKSYTRPGDLRNHYRKKHDIGFPGDKAKPSQKEGSCSLAETRDDRTTKPMQSNLCGDYLRETSPLQISKGDSGGTPVTVSLIRRLESCLSELSSQSTKGFRIPLVIEIDGVATNMNIDMYKSHILPTDSGTTYLGPFVGDVKRSESESRPEQLQLPPPLPQQVPEVRRRHASLPMDHDNMDAVMAQQPIPTTEAPEIMSNSHMPLILPPLEASAQSSSKDDHSSTDKAYQLSCDTCGDIFDRPCDLRQHINRRHRRYVCVVNNCLKAFSFRTDLNRHVKAHHASATQERLIRDVPGCQKSFTRYEAKLMDYQEDDTTDELCEAKVSKKRENPDDDASHYSGFSVGSSEEGDDSDYECDNIITWNYSQHDALPSFLPYIRGYDENTSSPCSDSPESGSTTSGTASDTPAPSSASGLAGGNGLQGNGYTPPSAGTGFPDNGNKPVLGTKEEFGAKVAVPRPLPLICWYSAAGIACNAKHVSSSCKTRYLWCDHAWGKDEGLNHRLSDACQRCKRLFLTEELLEEHHGTCRKLIPLELEELNREPNRLGISRECKKAIEALRIRIEKETKGGKPPVLHDDDTMTLLKQRVDSNVWLYINGSNTSEKTARSELWKWYLIFKKLRPDDEFPRNPFLPAQQPLGLELGLGGQSRADARLMFMRNLNQDERLSELDNDQRTALGRVFLDTLEMLGLNQANDRRRTAQNTTGNPRKRQRISSSESCERAPDSTDLTPALTTPALAPTPIPVEVPPSVRNPVNFQHPTFTPPEVQNQLLPQIPSSVPQSFMPSADNLWLLQQQQQPQQQLQQQQEAEDVHLLLPTGDLDYINWTGYDGLPELGTRDY